jgi:hypothetical protein
VAKKEEAESSNKLVSCVGNSERFVLEIGTNIHGLKGYSFKEPFEALVPSIVKFYEFQKITWQQLGDGCSALLAGQKPGIDYGQLAAEVPKLRAQLEFIDKSLFETTVLVFATLLDQRPDAQNHISHITITTTQRDTLVSSLKSHFGKKLEEKNPNYTVASARVLKNYLSEKGYKCSDEPW